MESRGPACPRHGKDVSSSLGCRSPSSIFSLLPQPDMLTLSMLFRMVNRISSSLDDLTTFSLVSAVRVRVQGRWWWDNGEHMASQVDVEEPLAHWKEADLKY